MEAKICVPSNAQPRYCKPRPVPYLLRDKVDRELEHLLKAGVISPVQFSDWAASIVPVVKSDRSIRICGDYKVTVNAVSKLEEYPLPRVEDLFAALSGGKVFSKLEEYPLPRVEDLFAALSGGKVFSKLDLSHAYQQIVLEEDSKKFTIIINTEGFISVRTTSFWYLLRPCHFSLNN